MKSRLGLAEAGIWATRVNDEQEIVLVVKLHTDTIKWIQRGVKVNLLIGHICVSGETIRVIGLEVFDSPSKPIIPNLVQIEEWELASFDALLEANNFVVHFHNEQPILSVVDAMGSLPWDATRRYLATRKDIVFRTAVLPDDNFQRAQDIFEELASKGGTDDEESTDFFRWPLTLKTFGSTSVHIIGTGSFDLLNSDEGASHEDLLYQVLHPRFQGRVVHPPEIVDKGKKRELCDVFAFARSAFLFEAKVFSVFDKHFDQSPERKAKAVMKNFEKALGQLQGAVKRLSAGVDVFDGNAVVWNRDSGVFERIHAIVLASNTCFELPWDVIGSQLAAAQSPPFVYYHFLPLVEVQQIVTFLEGSATEMDSHLVRRAEIIMASKNALIAPQFVPRLPTEINIPKAADESLALRFAWVGGEEMTDWLRSLFSVVKGEMKKRTLSGRVDYFNAVGLHQGNKAMGVGIAINCPGVVLQEVWWNKLRDDIFENLRQKGVPEPIVNSIRVESISLISKRFKDHLMIWQFVKGVLVAEAEPDSLNPVN